MVDELVVSGPGFRLLFDGRCGLCRRLARVVARLDRGRRLALLSFDEPLAAEDLARLPREKRYSAFHLVAPSGEIRSGEDAVLPTLEVLAGGKEIATMLRVIPGGERAARGAYRWAARNRMPLGRLFTVGTRRGGRCDAERRER